MIYAKDKEGKATKQVIERRIYIINNPINEKTDTYQSKGCEPVNENIDTPINEKTEEINNNTSNEYYKNNSSKEKKYDYRRHSQNETYRTKEMENRWREEGLKEFEYPPVEEMSEAIKIFNIAKIFQAIERLGKSSYWKTKVDIDTFFNPINNYKWIRKAFNGGYDDFEEYDEPITQEIKSQDELEKRMQESDDFGDLLN